MRLEICQRPEVNQMLLLRDGKMVGAVSFVNEEPTIELSAPEPRKLTFMEFEAIMDNWNAMQEQRLQRAVQELKRLAGQT